MDEAHKLKKRAFDSGANSMEVSALVLQRKDLHYKCRMRHGLAIYKFDHLL